MKKKLFFILFILSAGIVLNSCKKEDSDNNGSNPISGNSTITAAISGRVTNESGNPVYGVSVTSNGNTVSTDMNGVFLLQGSVDEDRCVLQLTKAGYLYR